MLKNVEHILELVSLTKKVNCDGWHSKCDNAKTFKGADTIIKDFYKLYQSVDHQSAVVDFASSKGIQFNYIPSYSPTFGGLWEAAVKSAKFHFQRIIGPNIFHL